MLTEVRGLKVPMADLKGQYESLRDGMDAAVLDVLRNGRFILGENVKSLEQEIARSCGAEHGIGVASGTDALILALSAVGVGPGDEVITSPFTFVATVEAICLLGARPVFADIDPQTFNLDPAAAERKITDRTRAILPVHLYGQPADIRSLSRLAESHNLRLVWDGAQAIGSEYDGRGVGDYPDALTLSFYPTKNLGGAGDGGMIVTNDGELAEKVRYLRFHGSAGSYSYKYVGYCSRLDEIQAAILRVKMPHLDAWNEARRRNASAYRELLEDLGIELPIAAANCKHTYHQFTIRSTRRDELKNYLKSLDIDTGVFYPTPLHLEEAYRSLGCTEGDYPEAERACREVLSLPVFPELTADQLQCVASSIRSFLER